jgi:hypothetical protein
MNTDRIAVKMYCKALDVNKIGKSTKEEAMGVLISISKFYRFTNRNAYNNLSDTVQRAILMWDVFVDTSEGLANALRIIKELKHVIPLPNESMIVPLERLPSECKGKHVYLQRIGKFNEFSAEDVAFFKSKDLNHFKDLENQKVIFVSIFALEAIAKYADQLKALELEQIKKAQELRAQQGLDCILL